MKKLSGLVAVAMLFQGQAYAYEWHDNIHACVVENARYASVQGDAFGAWNNAPKSFFVKMKNCGDYAKDNGLPFKRLSSEDGGEITIPKLRVDACATTDFRMGDSVIEFDGLGVTFLEPVARMALSMFPVANDTGTVRFQADGTVDMGQYGNLNDGSGPAWFMLHARCTVMKP